MIADTGAPSAVAERVRELCRQFKLPTLAAETVGRFGEAGHADALVTLLEVMEQEAEDRRIRRVDRLRRTSKLPAGKTWETFEHDRTPVQLRQQLERLGEGYFVDRGVNVLAFGCRAQARPTRCAPSDTGLWSQGVLCCSSQHTAWCRICWPPRGIWSCHGSSGSWTTSTCL